MNVSNIDHYLSRSACSPNKQEKKRGQMKESPFCGLQKWLAPHLENAYKSYMFLLPESKSTLAPFSSIYTS